MTREDRVTAAQVRFSYGTPLFGLEVQAFSAGAGMHHVVGLNGCGKSTFLKILSGVLRPHGGRVEYAGRSIDSRSGFREYCRNSGYLWQNFNLRGSTATRSYLEYRAWLRGIAASAARGRALESLEAVGLLSSAEVAVGKLSGGMQRRVGIAAETLHAPHVLLLDEPSSGLDYRARDLVHDALEAAIADDSTIIMAAHEPAEIARYDSTVHVMSDGKLAHSESFRAGEVTAAVLRELTEAKRR